MYLPVKHASLIHWYLHWYNWCVCTSMSSDWFLYSTHICLPLVARTSSDEEDDDLPMYQEYRAPGYSLCSYPPAPYMWSGPALPIPFLFLSSLGLGNKPLSLQSPKLVWGVYCTVLLQPLLPVPYSRHVYL